MVAQARWMEPAATTDDSDDELWHVAIAPDEIKVLTLEQLDDLFRLDIIDENVKVWQPGMPDWQPLRVVAGMDSEPEPAPMPAPAPAPVRPPAPKPVPAQPWASPLEPIPSPFAATIPASAASSYPSPAAFSAPESIRPIVVSEPPFRPQSSSRGARWLVGLALVAGLLVTLHRNDVLRDAARAMGQSAAYQKLESAFGGPGFGTLRAVEELTGASVSHAAAASIGAAPLATIESKPAPAPTPEAASETKPREVTQPSTTKPAEKEPEVVSLESLTREVVAKQTGRAVKPAAKAVRSAPARASRPSSGASSKSLGIKGSGHAYDPLNPKL